MEQAMALYEEYYAKILFWYANLTQLEQMAVLFALFIGGFGIVAFFLIRRAAS